MDLERIEQALREGPPDEPAYVPGSFGRSRAPGWWFAMAGMIVAAVVTGIAIGVGLDGLRGTPVGGRPASDVTAADIEGSWQTDQISLDQWIEALLAKGFDPNDVGNTLAHDSFEQSVRYQLTFDAGGRVTVGADFDDTGLQVLNFGEYTVEGGVFSYVESVDIPPIVGEACRVRAVPRLDGDRLVWDDVELAGCGVDPSIAHTTFFDLAPYSRVAGD